VADAERMVTGLRPAREIIAAPALAAFRDERCTLAADLRPAGDVCQRRPSLTVMGAHPRFPWVDLPRSGGQRQTLPTPWHGGLSWDRMGALDG
jgi:hypothetical protein